jgi:hypothetical protein
MFGLFWVIVPHRPASQLITMVWEDSTWLFLGDFTALFLVVLPMTN